MTYPHANDNTTDSWHNVRDTSVEVAEIIWDAANGDADIADQIWSDGYNGDRDLDAEIQNLADELGEHMYWGETTYYAVGL